MRSSLIKGVREVTSVLSPLIKRERVVIPNRILVGTHHKAGTTWMTNIFRETSRRLGLAFYEGLQSELPTRFDIFLQDHSRFDLQQVGFPYRGLHVIRDPRDLIISACFYHQEAAEKWLHVRRQIFGGLTYQEKINSFPSLDDKLLFEMEYSALSDIRDMLAWSYGSPEFIEAKYEDLIDDEDLEHFRVIFRFLGIPSEAMLQVLRIAHEKSLFSGKVIDPVHVRSGAAGQWKRYFAPIHRARFLELFGDALVRLGYEETDEWAGG